MLAVLLTVSEITARPVDGVLREGLLREFAFSTDQTRSLLCMAWLAGLVAVSAGTVNRRGPAHALLLLGLVALLPQPSRGTRRTGVGICSGSSA